MVPFLSRFAMATSVLIVEDDTKLSSSLGRFLSRQGYEVSTAESVEDALEVLADAEVLRHAPFDVLLADLRLGGWDGIDLLRAVRRLSPGTQSVLMSGVATAKDAQVARELGVAYVLTKPFNHEELVAAIRRAEECRQGVHGDVHGLYLSDLLQLFHLNRRSLVVSVGGPPRGEVHLCEGEVIHAVAGEKSGEAALRTLLARASGPIRTSAPVPVATRSITRPFEELLLDLTRQIDESGHRL
jgi:CheY-like chemotaxis protein